MSNQYGIKEVLNMQVLDLNTNEPLFYIDYAQNTTTENAGERLFLNGGQGNYRLLSFDHTKTSTLKLTVPLVDINLLAMLAGDTIATGAQDVFHREIVTVGASGAATLSQTPIAGSIAVFPLVGERDHGTALTAAAGTPTTGEYKLAGTALTVDATEFPSGSRLVAWYQYNTPVTAKKFTMAANKFAQAVKIVGDGLWVDQVSEVTVPTKVTYHKAKPQQAFNVAMSADSATTLELTFDLFAVQQAGGVYSYYDTVLLA